MSSIYHHDQRRKLGQLPFEDVEVFERDGGGVDFGDEVWQGKYHSVNDDVRESAVISTLTCLRRQI